MTSRGPLLASRDSLLPPPVPYAPNRQRPLPGSGGDGEPRSRGGDESSGPSIGRGSLRDGPAWWTSRDRGCWPRESEGHGGQHAEAEGAWQVLAHQSHLHGQRRSGKSEYRAGRGGTAARRSDVPIGWEGGHSTAWSPGLLPAPEQAWVSWGIWLHEEKLSWPFWPLGRPPLTPKKVSRVASNRWLYPKERGGLGLLVRPSAWITCLRSGWPVQDFEVENKSLVTPAELGSWQLTGLCVRLGICKIYSVEVEPRIYISFVRERNWCWSVSQGMSRNLHYFVLFVFLSDSVTTCIIAKKS